jgi:HD-like signal output (HDOD) protein
MNESSRPVLDLEGWVAYFTQANIPVLRRTEQQLDELRAGAAKANARTISAVILQDPMMTLRMLAFIEARRRKTQLTDITTIERSLMMLGMEPFFDHFQNLPMVEEHLRDHPRALLGLLKVIGRARRATQWARDWAIQRHDLDVDEITVATLLYDFAEILMWCFAPGLALQVAERQKADRSLRSIAIQTEIYGAPLYQIKQALARTWRLPQLLTTLMDPRNAEHPRVRNVKLAVDLARHSANGWDDAALPDDYKAIEELLHINHEILMHRLGRDLPTGPADNTAA